MADTFKIITVEDLQPGHVLVCHNKDHKIFRVQTEILPSGKWIVVVCADSTFRYRPGERVEIQ